MQSKDLFTFFSGRESEQVAYIKRGTILANTDYDTVTPDVVIDDCVWRVYASKDGGNSWVSDVSPLYSTGASPWDIDLDVNISGYNEAANSFRVVTSGSRTLERQYILVGLWR